jgi:hypothetical protein
MPGERVEFRLESLETRVTMLEELPARMDRLESQIVQLRAENAADHTAMRQQHEELAAQMRQMHEGLATEMGRLHEEQKRHTSVLFEEALSRIAAMKNGRTGPGERNP